MYDVVVIGGGPAGLMASASAAKHGARVLLLDKGDKLGRKLGISGGGRCNVTNNKEIEEIIKNIPGNGRFLYSSFSVFSNRDIIDFFEGLGIRLKEEDRGRMFPISNKAKDVVDALVNEVRRAGTDIWVNTAVERVLYHDGSVCGVLTRSGQRIETRAVILATGGKSVPHTGSTGDGYRWAIDAGHTITELYPTEVPVTSDEPFIKDRSLQGLSLRDIELSVLNDKRKKIITHEGDMIFTHFGLSGPAVLRCSQFVVKQLKKSENHNVVMTIDLFPDKPFEQMYTYLHNLIESEPKKSIKNILKTVIPERFAAFILNATGLKEDLTFANIPKVPLEKMAHLLKEFPVRVNGTLSIEEAFVTGGGVNLKEVDPKTLHSKLTTGLYFCGEILDIHGYTGGYNITAAFTTGYTAGKSAAQSVTDAK